MHNLQMHMCLCTADIESGVLWSCCIQIIKKEICWYLDQHSELLPPWKNLSVLDLSATSFATKNRIALDQGYDDLLRFCNWGAMQRRLNKV